MAQDFFIDLALSAGGTSSASSGSGGAATVTNILGAGGTGVSSAGTVFTVSSSLPSVQNITGIGGSVVTQAAGGQYTISSSLGLITGLVGAGAVSVSNVGGVYTVSSSAGAGGSPNGSNTQVQFNDSGAFGGSAGLTYIKASGLLSATIGAFGTGQVASVGAVRLANVSGIYARSTVSSDIELIYLDAANQIQFGDIAAVNLALVSAGVTAVRGTGLNLQNTTGTTNIWTFNTVSGSNATLTVDAGITAVNYTQSAQTGPGTTGAATTISAQNSANSAGNVGGSATIKGGDSSTGTGGNAIVQGGSGLSAGNAGSVLIRGNNVAIQPQNGAINTWLFSNLISGLSASLQVSSGMVAVGYSQAANASSNAVAAATTITSQPSTGTGTTTTGNMNLAVGASSGGTQGNIGSMNFILPAAVGVGTYGNFNFNIAGANAFTIRPYINVGTGVELACPTLPFMLISAPNGLTLTSPNVGLYGGTQTFSAEGVHSVAFDWTSTSAPKLMGNINVSSWQLGAVDQTTAAVTGALMIVGAGNATGAGSLGGSLTLAAGGGTSASGSIFFNVGALTYATLSTGSFTFGTGIRVQQRTITGSYSFDSAGPDYELFIDTTTSLTGTLPTPTAGRTFILKDKKGLAETNTICLKPKASEKIDGLASNRTLSTNWGQWIVSSDGTDWYIG